VFADRAHPLVFSEGHGREVWDDAIDLSRTVGWFTTMFSVQFFDGVLDSIRQTKDCFRSLSHNGWSYFVSRFLDKRVTQAFASEFPLEILFNYHGLYQQLERSDALFEQLPLPDRCELASILQVRQLSITRICSIRKGFWHGSNNIRPY